MSSQGVNPGRRRVLIGTTAAVGAVGVAGAAIPFVGSWNPSAKARAAGAPVEVDISKLEPGQKLTVEWRGKPVWVIKRTPEALSTLPKLTAELRDPDSQEQQQPAYAVNESRAKRAEYFVVIGLCTHLGCAPLYRPDMAPEDLGKDWLGGFYCPCHGSKFDLAGRVYKGVPAPTNLEIPPYKFVTDSRLIIGIDEETA